jgi:hypothetical protein
MPHGGHEAAIECLSLFDVEPPRRADRRELYCNTHFCYNNTRKPNPASSPKAGKLEEETQPDQGQTKVGTRDDTVRQSFLCST